MQNKIHTLVNGLKVVHIDKKNTKLCKIVAVVDAGSLYDNQELFPLGTAHFVEHMVFNKTEKYENREAILDLVIADGGIRGAMTNHFIQNHFVSTTTNHIQKAFEYLSQTLLFPIFTEDNFLKEKDIILSECKKNDSDPNKKFLLHGLYANIFENKPLKNYALGSYEGISSITLDNINEFHKTFFSPERITLFVTGDFLTEDILQLSNKYFSSKKQHSSSYIDLPKIEAQNPHNFVMEYSGIINAKIACGVFLENISEKEYYELSLLSNILANNPRSRLMIELREKKGLVYQVSAQNLFTTTGYMFGISTQSEEKNISEIKELIISEFGKISESGILEKEIIQAKNIYFQVLERENDSVETSCSVTAFYYKNFKKLYDKDFIINMINDIKKEDIQKIVNKISIKELSWITMVAKE